MGAKEGRSSNWDLTPPSCLICGKPIHWDNLTRCFCCGCPPYVSRIKSYGTTTAFSPHLGPGQTASWQAGVNNPLTYTAPEELPVAAPPARKATMPPSRLAKFLDKLLASNGSLPTLMLWGAPGIGKTDLIHQAAERSKRPVCSTSLVIRRPHDFSGIPYVDKEKGDAKWLPPDWLPTQKDAVLFFDDITAAREDTQAALYQLILEKQIGSYRLPAEANIIAAGNRADDRGVFYEMPDPLRRRLLHVTLEISVEDWLTWGKETGRIHPVIRAFIEAYPERLWGPRGEQDTAACPRTWEFASNLFLHPSENGDIPNDEIASAVGVVAALELKAFCQSAKDGINARAWLDGETNEIPTSPGGLSSFAHALVFYINDKRLGRFQEALKKLPAEFSQLTMTLLREQRPDLLHQLQ